MWGCGFKKELDFGITRVEYLPYVGYGTRGCCCIELPTGEVANLSVQEAVSSLEQKLASRGKTLESIYIFDGPYYMRAPSGRPFPSTPLLYIHYYLPNDLHVNEGLVMVVGKDTGEVYYNGTDGI